MLNQLPAKYLMNKNILLYLFLYAISAGSGLSGQSGIDEPQSSQIIRQDRIKENQILFNGKVWRNLYSMIKGDQFLFSTEYLPGSLTINGITFNNLSLNYDIYNDEVLIRKSPGSVVQLNKEMIDSFTLIFDFKIYRFKNTLEDSLPGLNGFVKVLYSGKSALYIKYRKEIESLAVDDKYDLFFRTYKLYLLERGTVNQVSGKSDFLKVLEGNKTQIKDYMKKNKLKVSKKEPESFVPVIRYYDSISQ
jgi:hypothetical protein